MGESRGVAQFSSKEHMANDRLDSWKEIAAHLNREVRTVQRWEKAEGLPVYRHTHSERASVYAYKAELDAWWNYRRPRLEQEVQVGAAFRRRIWLPVATAAALAVALGISLWLAQRPRLAFQQRDWVLTATFENRTGESIFEGTLEYALERELSNSRFVNAVPRERIADALGLMRKPTETRIDAALGREICLRDGGIRALLAGRIEKMGSSYLLSASLIEPVSGATVASVSEEADSQDAVLAAMRQLSNRVRKVLGERLSHIQESSEKLEKVTTTALRALQLYSRGMAFVNQSKWEQAADLLEQTVKQDPGFASAHILLAHCYSNVDKDQEAAPHYQRAFQLADTMTDRERYFIRGSYYQRFFNDPAKAAQAYELLVRYYPDHYWGANNLVGVYSRLGRTAEEVFYSVRRAEVRPNNFPSNARAVLALVKGGDPAKARLYFQRARALASPEMARLYPEVAALLELFPPSDYWVRGDVKETFAEVSRVAQTLNSRSGKMRDALAEGLGFSYLSLGRLKAAEDLFHSLPDAAEQRFHLALAALNRDDRQALRKYSSRLEGSSALQSSVPPILMARAGLLSVAQKAISDRKKIWGAELTGFLETMQGELSLARGQPAKAISLLQEGIEEIGDKRRPVTMTFFLASEALARAWELQGSLSGAIHVLEQASQEKTRAGMRNYAFLWMRGQWRLAQLYRKVGREQEAQKIEAEMLKLLAYADPDHPILLQLQRWQNSPGSPQ